MSIFPHAPIRVRVSGSVLQQPMSGLMSLAVDAGGVLLVPLEPDLHTGSPLRVPFDSIDGVECNGPHGGLVLCLRTGERLHAEGDARVAQVAADVVSYGRTVPELTRALRTLGGRRGGAGQDAFFRPLLEARRLATPGGDAALDAFDAAAIRLAVEGQLAQLAVGRQPAHPAAQRALEAHLCDAAEPLLASLEGLDGAARRAREAPPGVTLSAWRDWAQVVLRVFERADTAWLSVRATLEASAVAASPPAPSAADALWNKVTR